MATTPTGFPDAGPETRLTNAHFDALIPTLSDSELKAFLLIARSACSRGVQATSIPARQFREAGLDKRAATEAIKSLLAKGLVLRFSSASPNARTYLMLNFPRNRALLERHEAGELTVLHLLLLLNQSLERDSS